jgi:hypothetical protein
MADNRARFLLDGDESGTKEVMKLMEKMNDTFRRQSVKKQEKPKKGKIKKIDFTYIVNPNPPRTLQEINEQYAAKYQDIGGYDIINVINNYSNHPLFIQTITLPKPTKQQFLQFLALCGQEKGPVKTCGWFNLLRRSIDEIKRIQNIPVTLFTGIPSELDLRHDIGVFRHNLQRLYGKE